MKPGLGNVKMSVTSGFAWICGAMPTVNDGGWLYEVSDIKKCPISQHCDVVFDDKVVGRVSSVMYGEFDHILCAHFTTDFDLSDTVHCNLPIFDYEGLQCMSCGQIHTHVSTACKCIEHSPAIRGIKPRLIQLMLLRSIEPEEIAVIRQEIIRQHFGGIFNHMILD